MLSKVDPEGMSKVQGKEAVEFLKKSGIGPEMLRNIWNISAKTNLSFLDRDEFYIALRLIAYA